VSNPVAYRFQRRPFARLFSVVLGIMLAFTAVIPAAQGGSLRKYAVVVLDANSGEVLHSRAGDATRYPASIAKVMTLYILFEELEAGRLKLSSRLKVSKYAAGAQPSKLGLKPGSTISVENAIKALVTKSANDVARVIAENIGGTEGNFAKRMTRTARALGMSRTTYRNASGLPNSRQVTTVRDQARLGAAVFQHFPKYYKYFQTKSFTYKGRTYGNYNRLLGSVPGVDGIKTGYINASGFNLLTAARANGRHVVIAAFGFDTSSARNARVASLVKKYLPNAYRGQMRQVAMIAKPSAAGGRGPRIRVALNGKPPPPPAYLRAKSSAAPSGQPTLLAPIDIAPAPIQVAALSPTPPPQPHRASASEPLQQPIPALLPAATINAALIEAQQMAGSPIPLEPTPLVLASLPEPATSRASTLGDFISNLLGFNAPRPPAGPGLIPPAAIGNTNGDIVGSIALAAPPTGLSREFWEVQVGAAPNQNGATRLIADATAQMAGLATYSSYIQQVNRNGQEFYRARFTGFEGRDQAAAICDALKEKQLLCLALPG
jgi:D-alanyl-D-alanine carboxypeptidase